MASNEKDRLQEELEAKAAAVEVGMKPTWTRS